MQRHPYRGFSLVELMVAVVLAMVTVLVVIQVLSVFEARRRTTTVGNDAELAAAVGLFTIERDVRMSAAGLTMPSGLTCAAGINIYFDGTTISDGVNLAPVEIVDGDTAPDTLRVLHGDSNFGIAPATVIKAMGTSSADVTIAGGAGLRDSDLLIAGGADGTKVCTLMQMTADADATGTGWDLSHDSGGSLYNPPDPDAAFTNSVRYDVGDIVINLGQFGMRTFGVVCNDGGAPADDNSCDLVGYNPLTTPVAPTLADVESIVPQVVDFQVQYGVAPVASQEVDSWVDATGATWAAPTAANASRIKAVRIAILTRGQREPVMVSPASIVLWDAGQPTERVRALSDEERRYRYRVLTVVVPLINVIWAGV